jgi:hypothetical protein
MERFSILITVLICSVILVSPVESQTVSSPEESQGDGSGNSYWGLIAPPTDSTAATLENLSMPVWEAALVWPFRVITFPIKVVGLGLAAGIDALGKSALYSQIALWFSGRDVSVGVTPVFSASSLSGIGIGLTFFHNHFTGQNTRLRITGKISTRGSKRFSIGMARKHWEAGIGYRYKPNARYFGLGPESQEEDESFYTLEQRWIGGTYYLDLMKDLELSVDGVYLGVGAREPGDDFSPSVSDVFPVQPGFDLTVDGVSLSGAISHDTVEPSVRPQRGGYQRLLLARFIGIEEEDGNFWTYRADFQQFVPLWFTGRSLALRGMFSWMNPRPGTVIPIQMLMTNDDPDLLRGFRDFRWRDQGLMIGTVEYRWPIWNPTEAYGFGVDAFLFGDVGQVFGTGGEIALRNLTVSGGGGFRMGTGAGLVALFEVGWSNEEYQIRLTGSQVFDTVIGRRLNGRNPVPVR